MSKRRRGMSLEEKRDTLMSIFHTTKEPYTLKEIEKLGGKAGVVTQTIKDVLQGLVDDGLVLCEKVGTQNIYWSFPSTTLRKYQNRAEEDAEAVKVARMEMEGLEDRLKTACEDKDATDERTALLAEDEALTAKLAEVQAIYAKLRDNDPEVLQELADVVKLAKDGANRWIDNTFNAQSYFTRKRGMPASEAKRVLRMPEEFDYVE